MKTANPHKRECRAKNVPARESSLRDLFSTKPQITQEDLREYKDLKDALGEVAAQDRASRKRQITEMLSLGCPVEDGYLVVDLIAFANSGALIISDWSIFVEHFRRTIAAMAPEDVIALSYAFHQVREERHRKRLASLSEGTKAGQ